MRFRLSAFALLTGFVLSAPAADEPPKAKPLAITVDGDVDADMAPIAGQMVTLFYECYPKLLARFEHPDRPAPRRIRLVFVKGLKAPAQCTGDKVEVSVEHLKRFPKDLGMLTHELTHAVQAYPRNDAGWLTEGIADYARQQYGPKEQPGWKLPDRLTVKQSYKNGYGVTARFLVWLDARTPGVVDKLHRKMQDKEYKVEDFEALTGRNLDALWEECVKDTNKEK